jgi:hypothetical protein
MAKSNKSIFSFPNTSSTLAPKQKTFWDLANEKANKIKESRLNQPIQTTPTATPTAMQGSFQKIIGGNNDIGSGGFYNSMSGLEAASMRLADAASKRSTQELEKEYGLKESQTAKAAGYMSPFEMQMDARKKREEAERIQKQQYELQRQAEIKARQFGR